MSLSYSLLTISVWHLQLVPSLLTDSSCYFCAKRPHMIGVQEARGHTRLASKKPHLSWLGPHQIGIKEATLDWRGIHTRLACKHLLSESCQCRCFEWSRYASNRNSNCFRHLYRHDFYNLFIFLRSLLTEFPDALERPNNFVDDSRLANLCAKVPDLLSQAPLHFWRPQHGIAYRSILVTVLFINIHHGSPKS